MDLVEVYEAEIWLTLVMPGTLPKNWKGLPSTRTNPVQPVILPLHREQVSTSRIHRLQVSQKEFQQSTLALALFDLRTTRSATPLLQVRPSASGHNYNICSLLHHCSEKFHL